jgi:serine phosphatase RsbU (regulator of sigma subunit)
VVGFTRHRTEGWLAGVAVSLAFIANFQRELRLLHVQTRTLVLGFSVSLGTVSTILSLLIITVLLLRRFIASQRRQELWKLEIEQARQVQQVLIPETVPRLQGITILSEYRPAREVGGDFFQVLPPDALPPEDAENSLVVVGDVTGKGLQAGMLVALIVGAVHTAARHTSDPTRILALINDQLCERGHSSATCMVLRIDRDGHVDLSHAGHLPPYLNGREVTLEGALPLGTISGIDFPLLTFQLNPGDSLLVMSDGVVEAQDPQGQLFGFERIDAMLRNPISPREIANAAQKFGQEDDILVLELQWMGAPQPV